MNRNPNFLRLIEHLRQCLREREFSKEQQQQRRKIYSINHFIEHLRQCIHDNPLLARALFRFYHAIKNFSSQKNRKKNGILLIIIEMLFELEDFSSTILDENEPSKNGFEEKISVDTLYGMNEENASKSDLSKLSSITARSTKSTRNFVQTLNVSRQPTGLLTKTTFNAIRKVAKYPRIFNCYSILI